MDSPRAADGERRVTADQWDTDGWQILASEADKVSFEVAKSVYERLVFQFSSIGKFWKSYAEHLAREQEDDHEAVIAIYERAVQAAPTSIELWRSYLTFVTDLAMKVPGSKLESDAIAVHEKAVTVAGLDLNAHPLWSNYIEFLKHSTLGDSQRRDALRRVYQRAVRNPMQNLDSFWRDYSAFEQTSNSNKELARGLLAENQPKNIDARAEFRARRTRREGLTLSTLPVPPRGRAKESSQAQQWRKFIAHEKTNPFSLSEPDLFGRVVHAFESALAPLYRYPDVWLEYLSYVYGTFSLELEQAASKSNDKETSKTATDDSLKKRIATALEPLLVRAVKAIPHSVAVHVHANWFYSRIGSPGKGVTALDNLCRKHPSPLAYVHFMRAARKHDGKDSARKIFGRARKDSKGTHPSVYVAAAYMEFSMNKDYKVTRNVFEFGLKNFAKNAVITTHYVNWLWGIGDLEYARVVLKKVMPDAKGTTEEVRQLWERWLELEEQFGDVASVDSIERLWKESGVGRTGMGVVHDVLRRSRFLSFEGLREDEMAAVDGLLQGNVDNNANNAGSGGGRRDPRTGRRVASSGTNKEGSSGGQRRGGEGSSQVSVLKIATESLHRMAASMPPIAAPAPGVDVLFRMITDTPDSFSGTPAGANSGGSGQRKGKDGAAGKKRKGEEMDTQASSVGNMATGGNVAPPQDVFRARQAAKQSRLR